MNSSSCGPRVSLWARETEASHTPERGGKASCLVTNTPQVPAVAEDAYCLSFLRPLEVCQIAPNSPQGVHPCALRTRYLRSGVGAWQRRPFEVGLELGWTLGVGSRKPVLLFVVVDCHPPAHAGRSQSSNVMLRVVPRHATTGRRQTAPPPVQSRVVSLMARTANGKRRTVAGMGEPRSM